MPFYTTDIDAVNVRFQSYPRTQLAVGRRLLSDRIAFTSRQPISVGDASDTAMASYYCKRRRRTTTSRLVQGPA